MNADVQTSNRCILLSYYTLLYSCKLSFHDIEKKFVTFKSCGTTRMGADFPITIN